VSNCWDFALGLVQVYPFRAVMLVGHPGKLAKLAASQWDTHSARSGPPTSVLADLHSRLLGRPVADAPTTEGIFMALDAAERKVLGNELARAIRRAIEERLRVQGSGARAQGAGSRTEGVNPSTARRPLSTELAVMLVDMAGQSLGSEGDFAPWTGPP
jgi:cobalt-precorrin-5B (C1)-methyltransferase